MPLGLRLQRHDIVSQNYIIIPMHPTIRFHEAMYFPNHFLNIAVIRLFFDNDFFNFSILFLC